MSEERTGSGSFDFANQTTVHPLGLGIVILGGLSMLALPRRHAVWPVAIIACLVSPAQRIVIGELDFNFLRILVLFAWMRIITRGEIAGFRWQALDTVLFAWAAVSVLNGTLLAGTAAALINRLGLAFDAVGMYFAFRCLVRDWRDVDSIVQSFIIVSIPVALAFSVEKATGRNPFAFFGGVSPITVIREGRLRCQGAFAHPILAGCFWASLMPLFAARYWKGGIAWTWGLTGLGTSCLIIFNCSSSTPVMAVLFCIVGAAFFALRRSMRVVRWTLVCVLAGLHLVMNAPVYHLISRIDVISGSTGWHRFNLIDKAVKNFNEWWLIGVSNITHWNIWNNDITNQYVLEGVTGGAAKLALFVVAISLAFGCIGRLWRSQESDRYRLAMAWALGVSLFVHIMNYWAVSYFGQIIVMWYLLLAIIGSLSAADTTVMARETGMPGKARRALAAVAPVRAN